MTAMGRAPFTQAEIDAIREVGRRRRADEPNRIHLWREGLLPYCIHCGAAFYLARAKENCPARRAAYAADGLAADRKV